MTKADYIAQLDEIPIPEDDLKSNGGMIPDDALYGEWLYKNDPIAFSIGFLKASREEEFARFRQRVFKGIH